ncbi:hypothetical protein VQ643_02550 [Pseudomonas sp. F1_0610]|uniref:hypothetical protein n=1 Tax=Pseudomonas sp. F1_0610 TaxID=3114284 RepID=UPI0039C216AA
MSENIIIIAGFVIVSCLVMAAYYFFNKGKLKKYAEEMKEHKAEFEKLVRDPNTVRVAMWINIDDLESEAHGYWHEYETNLSNGIGRKVKVALFNPGSYHFVVSSNSNRSVQGVAMDVELEAGVTYQLGCNSEDGAYFVVDPDPDRYAYKG